MTSESVHFRVGDFSCVSLPDVIETLREVDIENMFTYRYRKNACRVSRPACAVDLLPEYSPCGDWR